MNKYTDRTVWLFDGRLSLSYQRCPMWSRGGFCYYDNGGRLSTHCYSASIVIGKRVFGLTLWRIGRWTLLLRWLPVGVKRDTLQIGWLPRGSQD